MELVALLVCVQKQMSLKDTTCCKDLRLSAFATRMKMSVEEQSASAEESGSDPTKLTIWCASVDRSRWSVTESICMD